MGPGGCVNWTDVAHEISMWTAFAASIWAVAWSIVSVARLKHRNRFGTMRR